MTGEMFNQFFEHIIWTNYGGPVMVIPGRDIGMFIVGYLTHLVISALIEIIKDEKTNKKNKREDDKR
jgi:hypothetical protein